MDTLLQMQIQIQWLNTAPTSQRLKLKQTMYTAISELEKKEFMAQIGKRNAFKRIIEAR